MCIIRMWLSCLDARVVVGSATCSLATYLGTEMNWIVIAMLLVTGWSTTAEDADSVVSAPVVIASGQADEGRPQVEGTPMTSPDAMLLDSEDATCGDFVNQAAAQTALEADLLDPNGLDLDLDGIACETPYVTPIAPVAQPTASTLPASLDGSDVDCVDFTFQEDAQVILDTIAGDPYNLDPSGDGLACSSLPSRDE